MFAQVTNARKLRDEAEARLAAAANARGGRHRGSFQPSECLLCYKKPEQPSTTVTPGKQLAMSLVICCLQCNGLHLKTILPIFPRC